MTRVTMDDWPATYEADVNSFWNGWAVPTMTRAEVARLAQDLEDETADGDVIPLAWEGDVLLVADLNGNDSPDRVEPGPDGRYTLDIGWCFWIRPTMCVGDLRKLLTDLPAELPLTVSDGKGWYLNLVGLTNDSGGGPSAIIETSDDFDTRQW